MNLNTDRLLLARVLWPQKSDTNQKRVLQSASRCLTDVAPLKLAGSGFQLLRSIHEPEVKFCMEAILKELDMEVENTLVVLPAPEMNHYSQRWYEATFEEAKQDFTHSVVDLAVKVDTVKKSKRTFNSVFRSLESITEYLKHDELVNVRVMLEKIEKKFLNSEDVGDMLQKLSKYIEVKVDI